MLHHVLTKHDATSNLSVHTVRENAAQCDTIATNHNIIFHYLWLLMPLHHKHDEHKPFVYDLSTVCIISNIIYRKKTVENVCIQYDTACI